ncbi:MAG TPA: hypothetical protein VFI46_07775 [Jiangellaceae bacterium]|nr:hypothetical protein [Jiangellaceae bacterium]
MPPTKHHNTPRFPRIAVAGEPGGVDGVCLPHRFGDPVVPASATHLTESGGRSVGSLTAEHAGSVVLSADDGAIDGRRSAVSRAQTAGTEGQTTLGLGVRARLPFRVFVLSGPADGSRVVIDVAPRW